MGKSMLLDTWKQHCSKYKFEMITSADIDNACSLVRQVKFGQDIGLSGKGDGIHIMPCAAGHMIGSAFWRITKLSEEVLYAVQFHHSRERHLDATVLLDYPRPTIMITDACTTNLVHEKRKLRDAQMLSLIESTLKNAGSVLMPTDSSGRVIELLSCLYHFWEVKKLHDFFPIVFLSTMVHATLANASTLIEWSSEACQKQFDENRENPFLFNRLKKCNSMTDFQAVAAMGRPMVILVPNEDLSESFARQLFVMIAGMRNSLVLFTTRPSVDSLGDTLLQKPTPATVSFNEYYNEAFTFAERKKYLEDKQKEINKDEDIQSDEEEEGQQKIESSSFANIARIAVMASYPMFPGIEKKYTGDIYGATLNMEHFVQSLDEVNAEPTVLNKNIKPVLLKKEKVYYFNSCHCTLE